MVLMSLNLGEDDLVVRLPIGIGDNIVAMKFTVKCTVITNLMNLAFFLEQTTFFLASPAPAPFRFFVPV